MSLNKFKKKNHTKSTQPFCGLIICKYNSKEMDTSFLETGKPKNGVEVYYSTHGSA